jgi:hypothetical protein
MCHVALLIETSRTYGRDLLRGVRLAGEQIGYEALPIDDEHLAQAIRLIRQRACEGRPHRIRDIEVFRPARNNGDMSLKKLTKKKSFLVG